MARETYAQRLAKAVSRYEPSEERDLLIFRRSSLGEDAPQADAAYLRWQSLENPVLNGGGPAVWVLRHKARIIGQLSAIPVALHVLSRTHRACWGVDLIVEDRFRGRGVGAALSDACVAEFGLTLGVAVSAEAQKALVRSGWKDLGTVPVFLRPVQGMQTLLSRVMSRGSGLVGPPLDAMLRAADTVAGWASSAWAGLRFEQVDRFDDRADELWKEQADAYDVITRRDRETLNWRFADHPIPGRYQIVYALAGDRLAAYAVVRIGRWKGDLAGYIVDFFGRPAAMTALIVECLRVLRNGGAKLVYCWQTHCSLHPMFKRLGFIQRSSGCVLMVKVDEDSDASTSALLDPERWYLTAGDSDIDRPRVD